MRRQVVVTSALFGCLALVACEDGPKQTYAPPPANASNYWNNGRSAPDGGLAVSPAGTATSATSPFTSTGNSGGNSATEICTATQQQDRWAAMMQETIRPPNAGAGLDLAGAVTTGMSALVPSPLNPFWELGDVETWSGLTIEQAEHINCQGTDIGTYFGGTNEFAIYWGGSAQVVLDSYVSNHKGFYLGLNFGYLGELDFACTQAACGTANAATAYKMRLDGTPTQISPNGTGFTIIGGASGLDWVNAANGDPTAMAPFDLMYRAIIATYTGLGAEPQGVTCNQTGQCELIAFPGGEICQNGTGGAGAVFVVAALNWAIWVQPDTTQMSSATVCRMDINLEQLMSYSNVNAVLKLDAQGPVSQTQTLGSATAPCTLALGMTYGDFLANCVQTDGNAANNTSELNKLNAGLTHDQEVVSFNVPGVDLSFAIDSTFPADAVVLDSTAVGADWPATEFNWDQESLALLANDWNLTAVPPVQHLQGIGALYYQYVHLAITNIYKFLNQPIPGGSVDALIASCIIPRDPVSGAEVLNTNDASGVSVTPGANTGTVVVAVDAAAVLPAPTAGSADVLTIAIVDATHFTATFGSATGTSKSIPMGGAYSGPWPGGLTGGATGVSIDFPTGTYVAGDTYAVQWPGNFDPNVWAQTKVSAGCTGLEGMLTTLQTTTDGNVLNSTGSNANNDDPTNVGQLDNAATGLGIPTGGVPQPLAALVDPGYTLGMKMGTQVAEFCDDAMSANQLDAAAAAVGIGTNNGGMYPVADLSFVGPALCTQGAILPLSFSQVVNQLGAGQVSNLPIDIRDTRFYFEMYGLAMIQVMEQTKSDGSLASMPAKWGTDGVNDPMGNPTKAPISFNDLFFDSIGSGQFGSMEYVDRRFVCPAGVSTDLCNDWQPATDLTFSADIKDGIMSQYDVWRYYYRGEQMFYDATQDTAHFAPGRESNGLVSNVFGSPLLPVVFNSYQCATTPASADPMGTLGCQGTFGNAYADSFGPLTTIDGIPLDFTEYQGAWNPTSLSLGYALTGNQQAALNTSNATWVSPISVLSTYPNNPTNYTGTIATQATVQIPALANPYDQTTVGLEPGGATTFQALVNYVPKIPINGFPMAVYGDSTLDSWVESATLDLRGISTSMVIDYNYLPTPTARDPNATTFTPLAVESSDFLGDVFMCFIPGATLHGNNQPFLTARMFTSVARIMDWLQENPSAYSNSAPGCGIVVRWSSFDNYVDLIDVTSYGVRIDVTQGGGFGRVVGIEAYVPGQASEE